MYVYFCIKVTFSIINITTVIILHVYVHVTLPISSSSPLLAQPPTAKMAAMSVNEVFIVC